MIWTEFFCLHKKFLVYNLVSRNLKVKYRRSFFGFFWTVLAPLLTSLVYHFVFKVILKVDRPNYLALVVSGIMCWNFFSATISETLSQYVDHQSLITKIYVPLQVFNFVTSVTNLTNLIFSMPIVLTIVMIQTGLNWTVILAPVFIAELFLITYSISIVFSSAFVFVRDLRQLISILLQVLFYATPILYGVDMIPEQYRVLLLGNPLGFVIPNIQSCLIGNFSLTPTNFVQPAVWTSLLVIAATIIVRKARNGIVENL